MKSPMKIAAVLLAMAAFAACGKGKTDDTDKITTVTGALLPDETTPIGQ
jgi:hypothetical protein